MMVDAVVALGLGVFYDKACPAVVSLVPLLAGLATASLGHMDPLVFAILWGAAMGGFESVYRSIVADSLGPSLRGLGFGAMYFSMGTGWALGNLALSQLGPTSALLMVAVLESMAAVMVVLYSSGWPR